MRGLPHFAEHFEIEPLEARFPRLPSDTSLPNPVKNTSQKKSVYCSGMMARKINDKNADMDYHAVPPPEIRGAGFSKCQDLCQQDSERVSRMTPGTSSSGQLEAAGASSSRRPVATEDPSSGRTVHLHPNTDGNTYIRKFDDAAKNFKPQSDKEHEFNNEVLD